MSGSRSTPRGANPLSQLLLTSGRRTPDKAAVTTPDGARTTYGDLDLLSARLANLLRDAFGIEKGDRIAVQVGKRPEVLALNIACARMGAIYLPLNTSYTDREACELLDDATPSLLVRDAPLQHGTPRVDFARLLSEAQVQSGDFEDVACGRDTPAAMIYTSGTTGRPKGALLTHGGLVSNCEALMGVWEFTQDDVLLHVLPLFHIHGLFVASYCALASGGSMLMMESSNIDDVLVNIPKATVLMGVPTHYTRLLSDPRLTRELTRSMRLFISGSAPMLAATHEGFVARTGHEIVERYGMTEVGIITSQPLHGVRKAGKVGRALPGVQVRVSGAAPGDIEVKGPSVSIEYWNRPELRGTELTPDGWFKTGDLGILDEDGYLEIVGRAKDLVITGGLNVYPKELELVIDGFPGVLESAVIGLPDPDFGEAVTAVVVARAGTVLDESALRAKAASVLAPYKVPKRFIVRAELPRNAMGKVEKARLRRELSTGGT